jgi:hypothetical protein
MSLALCWRSPEETMTDKLREAAHLKPYGDEGEVHDARVYLSSRNIDPDTRLAGITLWAILYDFARIHALRFALAEPRQSGFICAATKKLQDGCTARCDKDYKHDGDHLDSVIAIGWTPEAQPKCKHFFYEGSCEKCGMSKAELAAASRELCADCGHEKDDSSFHFEAPGTNWGAALHHFRPALTKENIMEVAQDKLNPHDWRVENILEDGAAEVTIFCGVNAESRAKEFASRKVKP